MLPRCSVLFVSFLLFACSPSKVPVQIVVSDKNSKQIISSRIEIKDESGEFHIANNAIMVSLQCLNAPHPQWLKPLEDSQSIFNPYRGTQQFYSDGIALLELAPGRYQILISKGPEYRQVQTTLEVGAGANELNVELDQWIDPTENNWYGVDDHLHITRADPSDNKRIASWLSAEGLHIANLLEMGTFHQLSVTPQYAYGDAGAYRSGDLLLLTGEEHPRTHIYGHTIHLGTQQQIDQRDSYIVYEDTFKAAQQHGGVSGFAHFGAAVDAQQGLAITSPSGLVRFIEVLQFGIANYDTWYQMLNLGFRIAPSAGTDFPCGAPNLPGRERFYVKIDEAVNRQSFVKAVKAGNTFVSNGPLVEFSVDDIEPGGDLLINPSQQLSVKLKVLFDPEQDEIDTVEIIVNGVVAELVDTKSTKPGELVAALPLALEDAAWIAVRVRGIKLQDNGPMTPKGLDMDVRTLDGVLANSLLPDELYADQQVRASFAHTGAVYAHFENQRSYPGQGQTARDWIKRLDQAEQDLQNGRVSELSENGLFAYSTGITEAHLQSNKTALLSAIDNARRFYQHLAAGGNNHELH